MRFIGELLIPGMASVLVSSVWFIGSAEAARQRSEHLFLPPLDPTFVQRMEELAKDRENEDAVGSGPAYSAAMVNP